MNSTVPAAQPFILIVVLALVVLFGLFSFMESHKKSKRDRNKNKRIFKGKHL